jgi:hypothetical protein
LCQAVINRLIRLSEIGAAKSITSEVMKRLNRFRVDSVMRRPQIIGARGYGLLGASLSTTCRLEQAQLICPSGSFAKMLSSPRTKKYFALLIL